MNTHNHLVPILATAIKVIWESCATCINNTLFIDDFSFHSKTLLNVINAIKLNNILVHLSDSNRVQ